MKNIKTIFRSDIRALLKNFFALVIAIGLCILPALYAWFNIYSNWDPYGNTGNIKIAIASADKGYEDENGNTINVGEEIVDSLKENSSIHWVITTEDKAKDEVKSGSCYAAVVLSEDFSESMYNGFLHDLKRPQVDYYENEKKNAVATKITDTAVSTLKKNINEMYISILVSNLFAENPVATKEEDMTAVEQFQQRLELVQDTVKDYEKVVASLMAADEKLVSSMDSAKSELASTKSAASRQSSRQKSFSAEDLAEQILTQNSQIVVALESAVSDMEQAAKETTTAAKSASYKKALVHLQDAQKRIDSLLKSINQVSFSDSFAKRQQSKIAAQLKAKLDSLKAMEQTLEAKVENEKATYSAKKEALWQKTVSDLQENYNNVITPLVYEVADAVDTVNSDLSSTLSNISEDIEILEEVLTGAQSGVQSANQSLSGVSDVLAGLSDKLDSMNALTNHMSNSEFVKKIVTFMEGDPQGYGVFFATPVHIETQSIYPVENYGSGVTPFYTTLAIWVGGIFLVSLIKVRPNKEKLVNPKPHELFLGRFLLFFLLGQIQTLIIVLGNVCLLKVQCLNLAAFWLAASVTSFTFMLLIYALTVSFGDVGKAFVVVIVVLQIAGSSGTYPIEILPEFYQKIYVFFPFPYAINAMREAICGMYEKDYVIYLLQLLLFAAAALLLGLVIRLPFQKVNHFMEKRMEDTGFM